MYNLLKFTSIFLISLFLSCDKKKKEADTISKQDNFHEDFTEINIDYKPFLRLNISEMDTINDTIYYRSCYRLNFKDIERWKKYGAYIFYFKLINNTGQVLKFLDNLSYNADASMSYNITQFENKVDTLESYDFKVGKEKYDIGVNDSVILILEAYRKNTVYKNKNTIYTAYHYFHLSKIVEPRIEDDFNKRYPLCSISFDILEPYDEKLELYNQ